MKTYYAFEIAMEGSYFLYVSESFEEREKEINLWLSEIPADEIETYAFGVIEAESKEEAMNRIRKGEWQYTQKA